MKALKTFLVDYNTRRNSHPALPFFLTKVLLTWCALQILAFLSLNPTDHQDIIANSVNSVVSLFNLPYFCKKAGIPLLVPFIVFLLLNLGYFFLTLLAILLGAHYKKFQDWSLSVLCKIEHYALGREIVFISALATGMVAIFRPQEFILIANSTNSAEKVLIGFGIILVVMTALHFYWQSYIHISVSYNTETVKTELRSSEPRMLRGALVILISAFACADSPTGAFVCVGICLFTEVLLLITLGNYPNVKMNNFSLWIVIIQLPLYFITLLSSWKNNDFLTNNTLSQRRIGVLLIAPFVGRIIRNLERKRMTYFSKKVERCLSEDIEGFSWFEVSQLNLFLRQMWSTFTNLQGDSPQLSDIVEAIIRWKKLEDNSNLPEIEDNIMEKMKDIDFSEYLMKVVLKPSLYDFINGVYSCILSREKKTPGSTNVGCYLSYIAFHKDITGNYGKAFIILAQLQKALGSTASTRAMVSIELVERVLQRQIAENGSQKTISAEMLFSFVDRSEKIQSSIESYVSEAFAFYEMLQKPIVSTSDVKNRGKKLLKERASIIKELDSLIKINEYHQQTLLLYEFFLSEIVEEKAEGRFFQIKNRIDIFHVTEYYTLYRQKKFNGNPTDLETRGWDMSIEFFANQIDDCSSYSVIVFSLNPENIGKLMRYSPNLCVILDIIDQEMKQMNISNIEASLFNPQNLKTLQEKILKGEISLTDLTEDCSLYLKHKSGSLIAYSAVADIEIYGQDPCIACYLRKKKMHEQEFILFSVENESKLVGMSQALLDNVLRCKPNFNEMFNCLEITDMIPALETILKDAPIKPAWIESDALLIIPSVPRLSISQAFYMINYTGKIQAIPLVGQQIGIIEIQYAEPISLQIQESKTHNNITLPSLSKFVTLSKLDSLHRSSTAYRKNYKDRQITEEDNHVQPQITSARLLTMFKTARAMQLSARNMDTERFTQTISSPILKDQQERTSPLKIETERKTLQNGSLLALTRDDSLPRNSRIPQEEIELVITSVRRRVKPKLERTISQLQQNGDIKPGTSISLDCETSNKVVEPKRGNYRHHGLNKGARGTEKITLGRASSIGSSIGAHMGFLRSIIIERKTPAVLTAINLFGLISLISTVVSVLVAYFILSSRYNIFSLFTQSASFPSFMRAISPAYMVSAEIEDSVQLFPVTVQPLLALVASFYSLYFFGFSLGQHNKFVLGFDLPFLSKNITTMSIPATFPDFPQLDRNLAFYEANVVFQAYTYKLNKYNFSSEKMDSALLNFTRAFIPEFNEMYKNISDENFKNIYNLHDSTNLTLDVIMIIGIIISVLLMAAFIPIYWRYQKMEMVAFTKLCGVTMKEFEPSLKKITITYERLFGKTLPALRNLQENLNYHKKRTIDYSRNGSNRAKATEIKRNYSMKRSLIANSSNLFLVSLLLSVSILLSGTYIAINVTFKAANTKILPFITDLEKISNGLPSCLTAQAIMTRLFNEVLNPKIKQTLPTLLESYQGVLNDSIASLKEMNSYLLNLRERAESNEVLSEDTKEFFRNLTDSRWCWGELDDGSNLYDYCVIMIKGVANSGLVATQNQLMEAYTEQITKFTMNPTILTIYSFYFSPDVIEFMLMTLVVQNYFLQMLKAEQADVGDYIQKLYSQTHLMLGLCLLYNVVLLFLLWLPTITYLRKRFILARSIFLLLPTKVLLHNSGINNLFKVW